MFDEFLRKADELRTADEPFAMAVVVRSEPPVSGKPGYKAIIRADGTMWGWIGGGCTRPLVIKEAMKSLEDGKPRLMRITPEPEAHVEQGITEYAMTCHSGGALDVYVEPVLPKPHLIIFGRSLVAQILAELAAAINYRITVVASGAARDNFPGADTVVERVENDRVRITAQTYIVVATQGEDDEGALEQAALIGAPYVAFVASKTKASKILDYLSGKGISREALSHIKAPAGLDIQATTPEEIAVSILAEMIKTKRSNAAKLEPSDAGALNKETASESVGANREASHAGALNQRTARESIRAGRDALRAGSVQSQAVRRDPVCGMEVETIHARYKSEFSSQTIYFCCARCKEKFDESADTYTKA